MYFAIVFLMLFIRDDGSPAKRVKEKSLRLYVRGEWLRRTRDKAVSAVLKDARYKDKFAGVEGSNKRRRIARDLFADLTESAGRAGCKLKTARG